MDGMNLVAILLAAALIGGCGGDAETEEPGLPTEGTLLEYTRAGGFAFSATTVKIDADGSGTVESTTSAEPADVSEFELTDAEIEELRAILEEAPISSLPDPGDGACADCYVYTYAYGGDKITLSDASDPVPELDDLNAFLAQLPLPEDQPNGG
jgi:hypothetical protein